MSALDSGTLHLTDAEFIRDFESCELPNSSFHHADHVRLTWVYVRRFGEVAAGDLITHGIIQFATHYGSPQKYHHTMTRAWVRLVAAAWRATPEANRFEDFVALHPHLLDRSALADYYSASHLDSAAARASWIEPDLRPLP